MYISDCLDNPNLNFLLCESQNKLESQCFCYLENPNRLVMQTIKNEKLYRNVYFKDVLQASNDEQWKPSYEMRIFDCLNQHENPIWICKTFDFTRNKSYCICTTDDPYSCAYGSIITNNLFKISTYQSYPNSFDHPPPHQDESTNQDSLLPFTQDLNQLNLYNLLELNHFSPKMNINKNTMIFFAISICILIFTFLIMFIIKYKNLRHIKKRYTHLSNSKLI